MGKGKILVADDEGDLVHLVKLRLEACGYEVDVATGGEEALGKTRAWSPDLVLLDLMMPDIDGFEVCREMRANPSVFGSPAIVALSALADETSVQKALSAGADSYVVKPFEVSDLLATIEHYLHEKRNAGDVADGSAV